MRNISNFIFFFAVSLCPLQSHAVSESKCDVPGFGNKEYTVNEAIKIGEAQHYRDLVAGLKKELASNPTLGNKKSKICRRPATPGLLLSSDPTSCGVIARDDCTQEPFKSRGETTCCGVEVLGILVSASCCKW